METYTDAYCRIEDEFIVAYDDTLEAAYERFKSRLVWDVLDIPNGFTVWRDAFAENLKHR